MEILSQAVTTAQSLLPVWTAFGGIVLGGFVTFLHSYGLRSIEKRREENAIASAIVTEIHVILDLIERRKYIEGIESAAIKLASGEVDRYWLQVNSPEKICPIYHSHLDKIGCLPDEIRDDVVSFHQLLEATAIDLRPGGLMNSGIADAEQYRNLYEIASEMREVGKRILTKPKS